MMPTVYHFKTFDPDSGDWLVQPSKRTAEAIHAIGGRIVAGSSQYVAPSSLTADGDYIPQTPEAEQTNG
jgi:hypothetical protein